MSKYLNPKGKDQLSWLLDNGLLLPSGMTTLYGKEYPFSMLLLQLKKVDENFLDRMVLVVLINNGAFHAAAVCENEMEFLNWDDPSDPRPKLVFLVNKEKALAEVRDFTPEE